MSLRINDTAPDFTAETDQGPIQFHDWIGDSWAILFSHPKDFTPVCTTEFSAVAQLSAQWEKRGTKVIGLSIDGVREHKKWKQDIESFGNASPHFPIIADADLKVAKAYGMLPAAAVLPDGRTPADSATVRSLIVISPDKKVQLILTYPMSVGRNFAEVLRALDGLQKTWGQPLATPANWETGQDVIVAMSLNDDQAREKYGDLDIKLPYLRTAKV